VDLFCTLLDLYVIALFGRIILSWFPVRPDTFVAKVHGALHAITEPVLGPLRRVIPAIGGGGVRIDFSPIVVFLGIAILKSQLGCSGFL
jgi:YggT family protein